VLADLWIQTIKYRTSWSGIRIWWTSKVIFWLILVYLRKITSLILFIYIISHFFYFTLYKIIFFRSENGGMVSDIWSRPNFDDYSNVHIFLRVRRTEIYEEQKTIWFEARPNNLQLHPDLAKYLLILWSFNEWLVVRIQLYLSASRLFEQTKFTQGKF